MKKEFATPHINAVPGDFAKTVIMPGDPLRSKFIAENYLEDAVLVNNVRGIQGYTGNYKGVRISVMASGMGMPSMGIYGYELFKFFGVENIIRIGSAGALKEDIQLNDIIIALGTSTDSRFAAQYKLPGTLAPTADYGLLERAVEVSRRLGTDVRVGNILTTDAFYGEETEDMRRWSDMGVLAVEMEAAALYMTAARLGGRALAICSVSDHLITGQALSSEARQVSLTKMIELALETAVTL